MATTSEAPWYAAYPVARNQNPASIQRAELLEMLKFQTAGKDFVLVDLRRADHEVSRTPTQYFRNAVSWSHQGGTIRGSINLPAQSLFPTLPTLYTLFKSAGVGKVIWYCGMSSR